MSVVLVSIDTLRADRLGTYGYARETSPFVDARVEEAVVFERAYSTSSWTLPAMASLLTGQLPTVHGARRLPAAAGSELVGTTPVARGSKRFAPLADASVTLAERLGSRGFRTAAFATNPFLGHRFGLHRGFETYEYRPRADGGKVVAWARQWLEPHAEGGPPFFLLLHLMEPHLPYAPPAPERGRFSRGSADTLSYPIDGLHALRRRLDELSARDREFLGDAYDEEVAAVDRHLGELFAVLDRLDLWRTTLVALTSDHGEELFEHGGFEHGHTLYDEVIRVPLIVWSPGSRPGRRSHAVSLADVTPTILDALGFADDRPADVDGVSQWPSVVSGDEPARRPVTASGNLHSPPAAGAIQWPWKVVVGGAGSPLVFDLARDPAERHALDTVPVEAEGLIALSGALLDRELEESGPVTLDEDTLERLRSLGYLE